MDSDKDLNNDVITHRNEFENRLKYNTNYTPDEQQAVIDSLRNLWVNRTKLEESKTDLFDEQQYNKIIEIFDNIYNGYVAPIIFRGEIFDMNNNKVTIDLKLLPSTYGMTNKSRLFHSFILGIPSKILAKQEQKQEQIPDYSRIGVESNTGQQSKVRWDEMKTFTFGDECKCFNGLTVGKILGHGASSIVFECTYEGKDSVLKCSDVSTEYRRTEFKRTIDILTLTKNETFIPKVYTSCICTNKIDNNVIGLLITQKIKYTKYAVIHNYVAKTIIPILMDLSIEISMDTIGKFLINLTNWSARANGNIVRNVNTLITKYKIYCMDVVANESNTMFMDDLETGLAQPNNIAYLVDFGACEQDNSIIKDGSPLFYVNIDTAYEIWNTNNGNKYHASNIDNEIYKSRIDKFYELFNMFLFNN